MSLKNIATKFEHIRSVDFSSGKRAEIYKATFDNVYMIEWYRLQNGGASRTLGDIEILSKERFDAVISLL